MADKLDQKPSTIIAIRRPAKWRWTQPNRLPTSMIFRWRTRQGWRSQASLLMRIIEAFNLTSRGNLVAVISNGTAVLGLDIGALASKPVMEGKAGLFKKFAGINVFDIEIDETKPGIDQIVRSLEPTFGGQLRDIKKRNLHH